MDDWKLIQEYVKLGSEAAFALLVDRYNGLVYHAALRQVRNPSIAEEVSQAVFIAMATKAHTFSERTILSGWLFQATRFAVSNLARTEARRKSREDEAAMLQTTLTDQPESIWEQIGPHIDEALAALSKNDREALLLRFFECKPYAALGQHIGITESGAKMRVERGLLRLRENLLRKGIAISSMALATTLSALPAQAAPVGLTALIKASAASNTAQASTSAAGISKGIIQTMAYTKLKTTGIALVCVLFTAATGTAFVTQIFGKNGAAKHAMKTPADRATPKGCLISMSAAMETGDTNAYIESFSFVTAEELTLKPTLEQLVGAARVFTSVLTNRFGAEASEIAYLNLPLPIVPRRHLESAKENIQGGLATVDVTKGGRPVELHKLNGEWKTTVEGMFHMPAGMLNSYASKLVRALSLGTEDLKQGKYKSALEAVNAVKQNAR